MISDTFTVFLPSDSLLVFPVELWWKYSNKKTVTLKHRRWRFDSFGCWSFILASDQLLNPCLHRRRTVDLVLHHFQCKCRKQLSMFIWTPDCCFMTDLKNCASILKYIHTFISHQSSECILWKGTVRVRDTKKFMQSSVKWIFAADGST